MDILEDKYVVLASKLSSFFGFWYTQTFRERIVRNYIVTFMLLYLMLAELCQLLTTDFNLRSIVLVLQTCIPVVSTTSIYLVFTLHFMTLKEIISWIIEDYKQLKDEIELKIMRKYINESKLFSVICGFLFYVVLSFNVFPSILQFIMSINGVIINKYEDPTHACFNHFSNEEYYYYPVIIHEFLVAVLSTTVALICYSLYFWFIQHACARFCIIKSKIHHLFDKVQHDGNVSEKQLNLSDKTVDIVKYLFKTRDFMKLMNKIGEQCYLLQMSLGFLFVVLDFLCLFQMPTLLQHKETRKDAIAFIIFIVYTMFPLYLNCFIGQRLMDYSIEVYREACLIPIYEMSVKTQKLLLTMLMMNAKPCAISIGKMFVSSHEFFSDLLRMALSFAIMLHSTQHA